MTHPIPQRIALQSPIKQLRVEYVAKYESWRIWLTANGNFTLGTFLYLHREGDLQRITLHPDGTESIIDLQ